MQDRGLQTDSIRNTVWVGYRQKADALETGYSCYDSRGDLIRIRFRIDKSGPEQERYRISKGSNPKAPFPINVASGKPIMILESELDAILIAQEAGDHVGVLGMGTTALRSAMRFLIISGKTSRLSSSAWITIKAAGEKQQSSLNNFRIRLIGLYQNAMERIQVRHGSICASEMG